MTNLQARQGDYANVGRAEISIVAWRSAFPCASSSKRFRRAWRSWRVWPPRSRSSPVRTCSSFA